MIEYKNSGVSGPEYSCLLVKQDKINATSEIGVSFQIRTEDTSSYKTVVLSPEQVRHLRDRINVFLGGTLALKNIIGDCI